MNKQKVCRMRAALIMPEIERVDAETGRALAGMHEGTNSGVEHDWVPEPTMTNKKNRMIKFLWFSLKSEDDFYGSYVSNGNACCI